MRGTGFLLWLIPLVAVAALLGSALWSPLRAEEEKAKSAEVKRASSDVNAEGKTESHDKGHGEKGHHDPTDLGPANASRNIASPDDFKADAAIATLVIFLLLMAILTKFAWKPIAHGLEAREKGILDKIEQARVAAEKATAQLHEYEARLAAATQEAQQIVGEARKTAETAKEKILGEAQALAQREREKAVADITVAKNQALREIAEKSVDTAIGLARNIIRREVRPGDHEQLIQDALKQFPNN
ncbi:MAG: F0F1 ATP synthase subunit B [Pirellulaceae bacterium]